VFLMMRVTLHAFHTMHVIVHVTVLAIVPVYVTVLATVPATVLVFLEDLDNGRNNQDHFPFERYSHW
jgi:hypothetical protein